MLKHAIRLGSLSILALLCAAPGASAAAVPVDLGLLGRTAAGGETTAEIAAFDPTTNRVFATNASANALDVYDFSNPTTPAPVESIPLAGGPNSVAYSPRFGGIVAVAVEDAVIGEAGTIEIFNADGDPLDSFTAGALPDMVTFTEDGNYLLAANEGEPETDGSVDPEGSVTVVDLRGGTLAAATTAQATFDGVPLSGPVRDFFPGSSVAEDLEPEYITTKGNRAYVSIQEANAIALLDIANAQFEVVKSLGFKDHGLPGNGFDANDQDAAAVVASHPNVFGMYQPDAISAFSLEVEVPLSDAELALAIDQAVAAAVPPAVEAALSSAESKQSIVAARKKAAKKARKKAERKDLGKRAKKRAVAKAKRKAIEKARAEITAAATAEATAAATAAVATTKQVNRTYVATANEGDARDYDSFSEEERAGDLTLDPTAFGPAAGLDRLNVTTTLGDTDADGDYDELYAFGSRSMSLLDLDGNLVYDTGDELEQLSKTLDPTNFNKDHSSGSAIDNRSDNKGPEPEAVTTGVVGNTTYAFLGAERSGMIYAYDVSSTPGEAEFAGWINTRNDDRGPEGIVFVPGSESPNGSPMLLVTYEVTGTVAAYSVSPG